jgi:hypothetical protein
LPFLRQWQDTALGSDAAIDADLYMLVYYLSGAVHMRILQDCHAIEYTDTSMSISAQLVCLPPWHHLSPSKAHHINANATIIFHRSPRSVCTLQKTTRHVRMSLSGYRLATVATRGLAALHEADWICIHASHPGERFLQTGGWKR